jgi:hypothetical protein
MRLILFLVAIVCYGVHAQKDLTVVGKESAGKVTATNAVSSGFVVNNNYVKIPAQTTATINAITSPSTGMIVFDETEKRLKMYNGAVWSPVSASRRAFLMLNGSVTLNESNDVVIYIPTNTLGAITLPAASSVPGKTYEISNYSSSSILISAYYDLDGDYRTNIVANINTELISDGSVWRKLNR